MKKAEPSVSETIEIILEEVVLEDLDDLLHHYHYHNHNHNHNHHHHHHRKGCSATHPVEALAELIGELRMDPTVEAQALADRLDVIKTAVAALQANQTTAQAAAQAVIDTVTPHVVDIEAVLGISPAPTPAPVEISPVA